MTRRLAIALLGLLLAASTAAAQVATAVTGNVGSAALRSGSPSLGGGSGGPRGGRSAGSGTPSAGRGNGARWVLCPPGGASGLAPFLTGTDLSCAPD